MKRKMAPPLCSPGVSNSRTSSEASTSINAKKSRTTSAEEAAPPRFPIRKGCARPVEQEVLQRGDVHDNRINMYPFLNRVSYCLVHTIHVPGSVCLCARGARPRGSAPQKYLSALPCHLHTALSSPIDDAHVPLSVLTKCNVWRYLATIRRQSTNVCIRQIIFERRVGQARVRRQGRSSGTASEARRALHAMRMRRILPQKLPHVPPSQVCTRGSGRCQLSLGAGEVRTNNKLQTYSVPYCLRGAETSSLNAAFYPHYSRPRELGIGIVLLGQGWYKTRLRN